MKGTLPFLSSSTKCDKVTNNKKQGSSYNFVIVVTLLFIRKMKSKKKNPGSAFVKRNSKRKKAHKFDIHPV
jgi:hypothetical protein